MLTGRIVSFASFFMSVSLPQSGSVDSHQGRRYQDNYDWMLLEWSGASSLLESFGESVEVWVEKDLVWTWLSVDIRAYNTVSLVLRLTGTGIRTLLSEMTPGCTIYRSLTVYDDFFCAIYPSQIVCSDLFCAIYVS